MAAEGELAFEDGFRDQVDWQTVSVLLESGQYEQLAEFLLKAQVTSEQGDALVPVDSLAVACQISQALAASQAEAAWHQRAYAEASRRESTLKQQLQDTLDLISGRKAAKKRTQRTSPSILPTTESNLPKPDTSSSVEHFSLWQRIQNLLGRGPSARKAKQKVATRSAETFVTSSPSLAETEALATPSPERTEIMDQSSAENVERHSPLPPLSQEQGPPTLTVHCLGPFRVYQDNQLIEDWPNGKGKSIFKYLVVHHERPVAKEILMDLFWPDANPDAARNRLNVAVHGLRKTLHKTHSEFSHILFQDDCYLLNPELQIWVDVEMLAEHFEAAQKLEQRGELASSFREYSAAEALYQGEFLEEDRYEDWLIPRREGLRNTYLVILDRLSRYHFEENKYTTCIHLCLKILAEDNCREDAHRRLMRCYSRQGQCHLALRQYHLCEEALARVLDVPPTPETVALYHQIRRREAV